MTKIKKGSSNVYKALGYKDADEMQAKAQLAKNIVQIIRTNQWSPGETCKILGLGPLELSDILSGKFRGASETELAEYLNRLSRFQAQKD